MAKRSNTSVPQRQARKKSDYDPMSQDQAKNKNDDWFDPTKAIIPAIEDPYVVFATPPREVLVERFKGHGNLDFLERKYEEE